MEKPNIHFFLHFKWFYSADPFNLWKVIHVLFKQNLNKGLA